MFIIREYNAEKAPYEQMFGPFKSYKDAKSWAVKRATKLFGGDRGLKPVTKVRGTVTVYGEWKEDCFKTINGVDLPSVATHRDNGVDSCWEILRVKEPS